MNLNSLLSNLDNFNINLQLPEVDIFPAIPAFLGVQAGQQLNHVTVNAQELFNMEFEKTFEKVISEALLSIGTPLNDAEYYFQTRAGWLNANPAVICVLPDADLPEERLKVVAFAKEGWISQKTAIKAIERFKAALKKQGTGFDEKNILPLTRLDKPVS